MAFLQNNHIHGISDPNTKQKTSGMLATITTQAHYTAIRPNMSLHFIQLVWVNTVINWFLCVVSTKILSQLT